MNWGAFQGFSLTFVAIFVALDIVGTLPTYTSLTRSLSPPDREKIVNKSMLVALLVAAVFVFVGDELFRYMGITLFDFKIAGGIVLLLVSLADLLGSNGAETSGTGSTGIVPLAVPLITGPAVLATLVIQVHAAGYWLTLLALLLNYLLAWSLLRRSHQITKRIGPDGSMVASKIAALFLAAIAVAMIRKGMFEAIVDFRART